MPNPDKGLRDLIATSASVDERVRIRTAVNDYAYYVIIVIVTMIVMFIPPLLIGCLHGDAGLFFPTTVAGWILWGVINGSTAIGNVSVLVLFKLQAKKNCRNNENYKKANEILQRIYKEKSVFVPRSPAKMNASEYTTKGLFIVIGSVTSFVTISSIILSFDLVTLLSTSLSAIVSLCVSWATMIKNEEYWTTEYLMYAEYLEKKLNLKREEVKNGHPEQDLPIEPTATGPQEPASDRVPGAGA